MYIEEMIIDDYLRQYAQFEQDSQQEDFDGDEPVMPEIAQKYFERGELFLGEPEDELTSPDIMSVPPDIFD